MAYDINNSIQSLYDWVTVFMLVSAFHLLLLLARSILPKVTHHSNYLPLHTFKSFSYDLLRASLTSKQSNSSELTSQYQPYHAKKTYWWRNQMKLIKVMNRNPDPIAELQHATQQCGFFKMTYMWLFVHVDVNIFNIFQIEMMSTAKWLIGHLHRLFNTRRLWRRQDMLWTLHSHLCHAI